MSDVIKKLKTPFFFEGAFGTYYHKKITTDELCEMGNLLYPDVVREIHTEYIEAGADAIKTNTFGANINNFPNGELLEKIIRKSFDLASESAKGTSTLVFADIGPIDPPDEGQDASSEYLHVARIFTVIGAKNYIFETMSEFEPLQNAISYIKEKVPDSLITVSFAAAQDGYTGKGYYYKTLLREASADPNVDICGMNCLCGPSHLKELMEDLPKLDKPICAMPNSGYPARVNNRTVFVDNVVYFAEKLKEIHELGADFLGGCCGTTPDHIRTAIEIIGSGRKTPRISGAKETNTKVHNKDTSVFKSKGSTIIAVEIDPPADTDVAFMLEASRMVKKCGADLITIADSPLARTRADSILLGAKVKREIGIDVMPHLSCRDRNNIGIKAALLGGNIENVNNVLVVTGDPVSSADRTETRGFFAFNSFKLISFIRRLNQEVFENSPFTIGAALNINAANFDAELKRAVQKQENGAEVFLTQPIFTDEAISNIQKARKALTGKILAGILPVAGYKNAMFLNNEVSGIDIPDNFLSALKDAEKEKAGTIIHEFTMSIIKKVEKYVDGYYIMLPMKRIDSVCKIIESIRS